MSQSGNGLKSAHSRPLYSSKRKIVQGQFFQHHQTLPKAKLAEADISPFKTTTLTQRASVLANLIGNCAKSLLIIILYSDGLSFQDHLLSKIITSMWLLCCLET